MTAYSSPLPAWAFIDISDWLRTFADLQSDIFRPVEYEALGHIQRQARAMRESIRALELPRQWQRLIRLERAAMRHYPHLNLDERLEFISANALERSTASALPYTQRELLNLLDRASEILSARDLLGMDIPFRDFNPKESARLFRRYVNRPTTPKKP